MYYSKNHNVDDFSLKKTMLTSGVILTIDRHDTLRPQGIQFRPFANNVHAHKMP